MRQVAIAFVASVALGVLAAPAANAGVTCSAVPSWCAPPSPKQGSSGNHSVPEPGTLGLLAVGAAAGALRLRRHLKK